MRDYNPSQFVKFDTQQIADNSPEIIAGDDLSCGIINKRQNNKSLFKDHIHDCKIKC